MQRMYLALMLNADLPHLGLVPLHPAAKRQDPGTKPTAPPAAYCATSQLPDDLLDSESYDEDNAWHAHCPAGVLTPWSVSSIDQFANSFEEVRVFDLARCESQPVAMRCSWQCVVFGNDLYLATRCIWRCVVFGNALYLVMF